MTLPGAGRTHDELIKAITSELTLSIDEVAYWHYLDSALEAERHRPLVKSLVSLIDPESADVIDVRDSQMIAVQDPLPLAV